MHRILLFLPLLLSASGIAQPAQTVIQGKTFNVYPLRTDEMEIPPYFAPLPDGEYAIFFEYEFKKKLMKKEYRLQDTTMLRAVFTIKNNLPEGKAVFYNYDKTTAESGNYVKGLREGMWEQERKYSYSKKSMSISVQRHTYHEGLLDGPYVEYSHYGKPLKKNEKMQWIDSLHLSKRGYYTKGKPSGKWQEFYGSNELWKEYTYADSTSWYGNVYDDMFPRRDNNTYYHGKHITRVGYTDYKYETILFQHGTVAYFDTLFRYDGIPEHILVKKDKNKPDSTATFLLTSFYSQRTMAQKVPDKKLHIYEVIEFREGRRISRTSYTYEGKPDEQEYFKPYYTGTKFGDLYLNSVSYYSDQTKYEFTLNGFSKTFKRAITIKGDTIQDFTISEIDTVIGRYACTKFNAEQSLGMSWIDYMHGQIDTSSGTYNYGRAYEYSDSIVVFKDRKRFTGIIIGIYHKKLSKQRVVNENGTWVAYINRKYTTTSFPYSYNTYAEIKNGRAHGKMIMERTYKRAKTINTYYMDHGVRHGTDISVVPKYKLSKWEREIARKHGITSKKVSFTHEKIEFNQGKSTGHWETREATGVISTSKNYQDGFLHGEYMERHEDGTLKESAFYTNGSLNGKYVRRYYDGTLMEEAEYLNGSLNGYLKKYKSNGEPSFTIFAKDNILDGQAILYNEIGLIEWKLEFEAKDSVPYQYWDEGHGNLPYHMRNFVWNNENVVNNLQTRLYAYPASFKYTEYFYTGRIAAEGIFEQGRMKGIWKFYDLDGNMIHEIDFKSEELSLPHDTLFIMGRIKSFYSNGKVKSTGYLENFTRDYDCKSKKNVYWFNAIYEDYWEQDGRQTLVKGNGAFTQYDEHGIKLSSGEYFEYQKNGYWKTWDKDAKLNSAGHYENGRQEGSWWYGDLEGLSFIDNACFDISSDEVMLEIKEMKKNLTLRHSIYIKGMEVSYQDFNMNMNKEKKYREDIDYRGIPNF